MLRRSCLVFIPFFFLIIQLDYIVQTAVLVKVMGPGHQFSFCPPYIAKSFDITEFKRCCFGSDCLLLMHINMFPCMCCLNLSVGSEF